MYKRKGVTLIELLIVVLILAALSAIAIPRISQGANKAKKRACETNIDIINSAIELHNAEYGSYPTDLTTITGDTAYFPDGPPTCPVDENQAYTIDSTTNRVKTSEHEHP